MRKFAIALMVLIIGLGMAVPASAGFFKDVPTDHWAYEALEHCASLGLIEGYPDGTFKGENSLTRYEMAMVTARLYDALAGMRGGGVDEEVMEKLMKLANEFRDELYALGLKVDENSMAIDDLDKRVSYLESIKNNFNWAGYMRLRMETFLEDDLNTIEDDYLLEEHLLIGFEVTPADYIEGYFDFYQYESFGGFGGSGDSSGTAMNGAALEVDQAYMDMDLFKFFGWARDYDFNHFNAVVGRHYNRMGEFGLAFDNGYNTMPGLTTNVGGEYWNLAVSAFRYGWGTDGVPGAETWIQGSTYGIGEGDEVVAARLDFGFGDSRSNVLKRDHQIVVGVNGLLSGIGDESGLGADVNIEVLKDEWFNKFYGEIFVMETDQFDLGEEDYSAQGVEMEDISAIVALDIYNDNNTKATVKYATIGNLYPGFSSVDNDPFTEFDALGFTTLGFTNMHYGFDSGLNEFRGNFEGYSFSIEHTWGNGLFGKLMFWDGEDQANGDLPEVIRVNLRYPIAESSDIGLTYLGQGVLDDNTPALSKVQGEFIVHF